MYIKEIKKERKKESSDAGRFYLACITDVYIKCSTYSPLKVNRQTFKIIGSSPALLSNTLIRQAGTKMKNKFKTNQNKNNKLNPITFSQKKM